MKNKVRKFLGIIFFCLPLLMGFYRGDCGFFDFLFIRNCTDPIEYFDYTASDYWHDYHKVYGTGNGRLYREGSFICDDLILLAAFPGAPRINDIHGGEVVVVVCNSGFIARSSRDSTQIVYPNSGTTKNLYEVDLTFVGDVPKYIAVGDSGTVINSTNWGYTWMPVNFPSNENLLSIHAFRNRVTITGEGNTSFLSTDGGVTWIDDSLSNKLDNPELLSEMDYNGGGFDLNTVQFVDSNLRYIGGENGVIFKTTNGGLNFNVRFVPGAGNITDMHFITADSGFVVTDLGRVRFTADGGTTWVRDTVVDNLFGGSRINEIMSFGDWGIISGDSSRRILAARDSLSITNVDPISSNIPNKFTLLQNYPNPFNPSTNIRFNLQKTGDVTLKIFDISGKLISTLINEKKPAGEYIVSFNGANLSSGVYFYTLQSGQLIETKKMVLLK